MRSNQRGFTLIELLAVIVILAIIALIATPIVLNIIDNARKSAAEDSVYGTMETVKLAYTESLMNPYPLSLPFTVTCTNSVCTYSGKKADGTNETVTLEFSGTKPKSGTFTLSESGFANTTTDIEINNLYCKIVNQKVTCDSKASTGA